MRAFKLWMGRRLLWLGLCLPAAVPAAVTNYVTTTADSGPGSLRQAILDLNAGGGGWILISGISNSIVLNSALPAFEADAVVIGPGTNFPTFAAGLASFRMDLLVRTQAVVTFRRWHFGQSGLYGNNFGTLALSDCAAPASGSFTNNGELQISRCSQSGPYARLTLYGSGRATIQDQRYAGITVEGGSISLSRCVSTGGYANGQSAVVNCYFCAEPPWHMCCTVERRAEEGRGGGILIKTGFVSLSDCVITNNSVQGGDGTIASFPSPYTVYPANGVGGGICLDDGALRMTNCLVSGNSARGGGAYGGSSGEGGGVSLRRGFATLVNCTISGNQANGGGLSGDASGGISIRTAIAQIINCTITANTATPTEGYYGNFGIISAGVGIGGLSYCDCYSPIYRPLLQNTVIAGNVGAKPYTNQVGFFSIPNDGAGRVVSQGGNLVGTIDPVIWVFQIYLGSMTFRTNSFIGFTNSDIANTNPHLGPLQDNGGPVFTHALLAGSPAIDAGTNSGLAFDARGQPRTIDNPAIPNAPGGDGTDIGAFEVNHVLTGAEVRRAGDDVLVRFTSVSDKSYGVQYKPDLNGAAWITLPGSVTGTGGFATYTDTGAAALPRRFYRLFERP